MARAKKIKVRWADMCYLQAQLKTIDALKDELSRARILFPTDEHRLAALTEEAMELIQAVLGSKPLEEIHKEAIQLAGQCIRLIEEGDSDYPSTLIDYGGVRG